MTETEAIERLKSELYRTIPLDHPSRELVSLETSPFLESQAKHTNPLSWGIYWPAHFNHQPYRINQPLSYFGEKLKEIINGRDFIDLGSTPSPCDPIQFANLFGAKRYIGVDIAHKNDFYVMEEGPERRMPAFFIKDDILSFTSKLKGLDGVVFLLSGLEASIENREKFNWACKYSLVLMEEINRVSKVGDGIVSTGLAAGVQPESKGYELIDSLESCDIYIKK